MPPPEGPVILDGNTVYLIELDPNCNRISTSGYTTRTLANEQRPDLSVEPSTRRITDYFKINKVNNINKVKISRARFVKANARDVVRNKKGLTRLMNYRNSGIQYNTDHFLHPESPHHPMLSATSTPYMSRSPVPVQMERDLASKGVETAPRRAVYDTPANVNSGPPSLYSPTHHTSSVHLLSPLEILSPNLPRRLNDVGPFAASVEDAISFLQRNGYVCHLNPPSTTQTTLTSAEESDTPNTRNRKRKSPLVRIDNPTSRNTHSAGKSVNRKEGTVCIRRVARLRIDIINIHNA